MNEKTIVKKENVSSFLIAEIYEINFYQQLLAKVCSRKREQFVWTWKVIPNIRYCPANWKKYKILHIYFSSGGHLTMVVSPCAKILNFVFQFIKYMKWHFGYTNSLVFEMIRNYLLKLGSWAKIIRTKEIAIQCRTYFLILR